MEPEPRRAARLVVVDSRHRVLLFQYAQATGEKFWVIPGGGLEHGETFEAAAAREALEELGLRHPKLTALGGRLADFLLGNRPIHQEERHFLLREEPREFDEGVREAHRTEGVLQTRWWTLAELDASDEVIFPEDLPATLRSVSP